MKVYYLINARFPTERAHGIQIAKMSEAFVREGVDITLVLPKRKTVAENSDKFYGLSYKIPYIKLPVIDTYNRGKWGFIIASLSFMCSYFIYFLWKKIRGINYVVYTIDMDQFSFALIPFLGVPYFTETHDAKKKDFLHKFFMKRVMGVITINQLIKERMVSRFGIPPSNVLVYPNAIDLELFDLKESKEEARKKCSIDHDRKIVLYSGKMYGWKGFSVFIDAAKILGDRVDLYIVGGTKEELVSLTKDQIPSNIVCVGQKVYTEIPLWLKTADVLLVLGTRENEYSYYYTSPMKLYEYMAAKKNIVASRTPAIAQMTNSNEVTFYEPDNATSLAKSIIEALVDSNLQSARRACAYQKVKKYTWKGRAAKVREFMELHI